MRSPLEAPVQALRGNSTRRGDLRMDDSGPSIFPYDIETAAGHAQARRLANERRSRFQGGPSGTQHREASPCR